MSEPITGATASDTTPDAKSASAHVYNSEPYGMLRIFLRAGDRAVPRTVLEKMFGRPAANAVLQTARAHGIPHGVIRQIVSGYLDGGHIHFWHHEYQSHSVPLYVELYGSRPLLEAFVTAEAELLAKCIVVFMEAEHWGIVGAGEVKR